MLLGANQNPTISVIVPVYNVEKYLADCLHSIAEQTYQDIEVIVLNDGSTDTSGDICDRFQEKYKNWKIVHQENQGLSVTRNHGIDLATGTYIFFVDSDDMLHPCALEALCKVAEEKNADIVFCDEMDITESVQKEDWKNYDILEVKEWKDYRAYFTEDTIKYVVVWNKLYKKSIWEHLRFPEGRMVEDEAVSYRLLYEEQKIYYLPFAFYAYRKRDHSIIQQVSVERYFDALQAFQEQIAYFATLEEKELEEIARARGLYWIARYYLTIWQFQAEKSAVLHTKFLEMYQSFSGGKGKSSLQKEWMRLIEKFAESPECADQYLQRQRKKKERKKVGFLRFFARQGKKIWKKRKIYLKYAILRWKQRLQPVRILNVEASLNKLCKSKHSIIRFGDGELSIMTGRHINFQRPNRELQKRLCEILSNPIEDCEVGIVDEINFLEFPLQTEESKDYWIINMYQERSKWITLLQPQVTYLSANITRPYMRYRKKEQALEFFQKLQTLWQGKDIVIVEGEGSRLGVGNDLFANTKSIGRVICPATDAFEQYGKILEEIKKISKDTPIFLALGPTATVLGYDLTQLGYRAYDIGHLDLEYEWMKMGVDQKCIVPQKYTNEVEGGNVVAPCEDPWYLKQIICRIK